MCSQVKNQRSLGSVQCATLRVEYIWNCVLKLLVGWPVETVKFRCQIRKSTKFEKCTMCHIQGRIHLELCSKLLDVSPIETVKFRCQIRKSTKFEKCTMCHIEGRIYFELCSKIVSWLAR